MQIYILMDCITFDDDIIKMTRWSGRRKIKPKSDCTYTYPIDLESNGI